MYLNNLLEDRAPLLVNKDLRTFHFVSQSSSMDLIEKINGKLRR
jgi:hypothetical protein